MMPFEHFLNKGDVRKVAINKELAKSLTKDMFERINKSLMLNINTFSKIVFENIYDGLRGFCDSLLALEGFKSYSHQASIAYLSKYKFDISIIKEFDQLRYKRNGSKYYGEIILKEDAQQIKEFYLRVKDRINKIIKDKKLIKN